MSTNDEGLLIAFGQRIKELRKLNKFTQMDLAKHLGYTSSGTIAQIENGQKGVRFELLQPIAEFFNVDVADLVDNHRYSKKDFELIQKVRAMIKSEHGDRYLTGVNALVDAYCTDLEDKC